MRIRGIDHFVITTEDVDACVAFYTKVLEMKMVVENQRISFHFGTQKINVHRKKAEFSPAAQYPTAGSMDVCLIAENAIEEIVKELKAKGADLETDIVSRMGARGRMKSVYLRDPDGNLIEIGVYSKHRGKDFKK